MPSVHTNLLIGAALDWAVALAEGATPGVNLVFCLPNEPQHVVRAFSLGTLGSRSYSPSTNWEQAGPIIAREMLGVMPTSDAWWRAGDVDGANGFGATPLIAAMRCYVAAKHGETVEIPAELDLATAA